MKKNYFSSSFIFLYVFILNIPCYGQYIFKINTTDSVFIEQKRVNLKINGQSFVGPILNSLANNYQTEIIIGISSTTSGVINFNRSIINSTAPILIESAKIYEITPKSVKRKIDQGYSAISIFSNISPIFDFVNRNNSDTQFWYSPITFKEQIDKLEKKRQIEIEKSRQIQVHDSLTQITSFYGVYRVRILTRGGYNIAELNEEGKLYFTENGVSLINIASLEPTLRCSSNKSSGIQSRKGEFVLNTNKSVYEFGSLILGDRTGAVTLLFGKKSSTITFEIAEYKPLQE